MSVTVKVRGKDKLARKLKELAPEAQKALTEANGQTANEMVTIARSYAPKRTGALAESIVSTGPGAIPPAYAQGGKSLIDTGAWLVSTGNNRVRYAHLVEFGTAAHPQGGTGEGTEHPGTTARPFFFPAYRIVAKKHKGRATRAVNKSIKKVAAK